MYTPQKQGVQDVQVVLVQLYVGLTKGAVPQLVVLLADHASSIPVVDSNKPLRFRFPGPGAFRPGAAPFRCGPGTDDRSPNPGRIVRKNWLVTNSVPGGRYYRQSGERTHTSRFLFYLSRKCHGGPTRPFSSFKFAK